MSAATLMPRERVLVGSGMSLLNYMAFAISRLVTVEVVVGLISPPGQRSFISVMRIKPVINVAAKVGRPVEPGACANKYPGDKPVRPVVAVWCTVIWRIREVSIRAYGSYSNVDRDLG